MLEAPGLVERAGVGVVGHHHESEGVVLLFAGLRLDLVDQPAADAFVLALGVDVERAEVVGLVGRHAGGIADDLAVVLRDERGDFAVTVARPEVLDGVVVVEELLDRLRPHDGRVGVVPGGVRDPTDRPRVLGRGHTNVHAL